jgi:hypothetical protein
VPDVRYMMATTAIHKMGDISRDEPDLCIVRREDGDDYIGEWVTGFGYVKVRFPKATTRDLTEQEKAHYNGLGLEMSGRPWGQIHIDDGAP